MPTELAEPSPAETGAIDPMPGPLASSWIGFAELEGWAQAVDPARPVLVLPLAEPHPGGSALSTDELLVVCQQVAPDGSVLYCRLRAASLTRCYGTPFDPDWREREAAWHSLAGAVEKYLRGQCLTLQRATVAYPRGLVLLQGECRQIIFDPAARRYALRPLPSADDPSS